MNDTKCCFQMKKGGIPQSSFVRKVGSLRCEICTNVPKNTKECKSRNNYFCEECINSEITLNKKCPVCGVELNEITDLLSNDAADTLIGELQVKCLTRQDLPPKSTLSIGCRWRGFERMQKIHLTTCKFRIVDCPNDGCTEHVEDQHMSAHLEHCGYSMMKCKHCDKEINRGGLADHERECAAKKERESATSTTSSSATSTTVVSNSALPVSAPMTSSTPVVSTEQMNLWFAQLFQQMILSHQTAGHLHASSSNTLSTSAVNATVTHFPTAASVGTSVRVKTELVNACAIRDGGYVVFLEKSADAHSATLGFARVHGSQDATSALQVQYRYYPVTMPTTAADWLTAQYVQRKRNVEVPRDQVVVTSKALFDRGKCCFAFCVQFCAFADLR